MSTDLRTVARRRHGLLIALALALGAIARGQAPEDQPIFRVETRLVEVDAVVRDEHGAFVPGLTAADFEILENGVPQEVLLLSVVDLPVDRRGRPAAIVTVERGAGDADVAEDPAASLAVDDIGRLYVMVLDSGEREAVQRQARLFVEEFLGPTDLMAIVHTGRSGAGAQGLTNDKAALLAAVDRYGGRYFTDDDSFRLLKEIAVNLNAVAGRRKGILFIGAGVSHCFLWYDVNCNPDPKQVRESWRLVNDALATAARNNIRVHSVDPTGLPAVGGDLTRETSGFVEDLDARLEQGAARMNTSSDGQSSLRLMAEDTGGRAIVNTNNFTGNFQRVVQDHSAYYVLAYYSRAPRDGEFQRITVRVRQPGLSVRARSGYRTPLPDVRGPAAPLPRGLSAAARTVLRAAEAPAGDVRVDVSTTVFRGDAFNASVLVESHIAGRDLSWNPGDRLEVTYAAIDRWGRARAVGRESFTMRPEPETRARMAETGLRLFGRLTVPAGLYEIRVVAHQPGGRTGSAATHVEVPHFAEHSLAISDLVVASAEPVPVLTFVEDDRLRRALSAEPTAARRFAPDDTLTIAGEIYDSHWLLASEIGVTSTIARSDGSVALRDERRLRVTDGGVFSYTGQVPLAQVGPGTYVLTVEAYTVAGIPAAASRQVRFEVSEDARAGAPAGRAIVSAPARAFEFISVRRSRAERDRSRRAGTVRVLPGGRVEAREVQLISLIRLAYDFDRLDPYLMTGGPAWIDREYFDLFASHGGDWSAAASDGYPSELRPLLRALLEEHFGVQTRIEAREMRVYALERVSPEAPVGPNLRRSDGACRGAYAPIDPAAPLPPCPFTRRPGLVQMGASTMADLARALSNFRPVNEIARDQTGLEGLWDIEIRFMPPMPPGAVLLPPGAVLPGGSEPFSGPPFFTAIQEQLGLRLERTRAPVDRLVVERARRPAED